MANKDDYKYEEVAGDEKEAALLPETTFDAARESVRISSNMLSASAPRRLFLYLAACAGNLAAFTCGLSFGWTSPEIPKLKQLDGNPLDHLLTKPEEGWVGSFLPLAAAFGPFIAGFIVDRIGRKKTLLIGAIPFLLAFVTNIVADTVYHFYLSRFLCGLGVGIIFTALPMYIGEISDDETRGTLGSFMQLFIVLGILFSYALGPYISISSFNIVLLVPPALFIVLFFFFIPESPYYLIQNNENEAAEEALIKLRGKSKNAVQKEIEIVRIQAEADQKNKASFFDIFKSKGLTKALFLSVSLVVWQQLSGINIILFYAQDVFTDAGVSLAPEICTILIGIVQVISSGATPLLVEKRGKRFLLILSGIGMTLAQAAMAYFFFLKDIQHSNVSKLSWLPIASLVLFIVTYCLGFGPLPWAVMGELFPGNIKSAASTVTASGCWVLGFFLTNYFGAVIDMLGDSGKSISFGFFGVCCFISAVFVYKLLPETTGKSLQEIQDILSGDADEK
nr:facilitated trehalose transporter Tret1-like [Leptinotarsa decemlineata]